MRFRSLLISFLSLLMVIGVSHAYRIKLLLHYTVPLRIYNKLDKTFYVGTCAKPIYGKTMSLCGLPQKIESGTHIIYVPSFDRSFPVFTTVDEKVYTCGTQEKPNVQLPLTSQEIIVDSFIVDQNDEPVALKCMVSK